MKNTINSRSARQSTKKYLPYAMALFIAVGCNTPEEKNPQPTPDPKPVVQPKPAPKMDTLTLDFDLGEMIFKNWYFKKIDNKAGVFQRKHWDLIILQKEGKTYLTKPWKLKNWQPQILEINGQAHFINDKLAVIKTDDNASHIYEILAQDSIVQTKGPQVTSFVVIEDNLLSGVQDINEISLRGVQQWVIFITPDNKKIFYGKDMYVWLDWLLQIEDLIIEKDYFSLKTKDGNVYYNPQHYTNEFIPYDKIIDREDANGYDQHKKFIIKDGNIVNFETHQVQNFLQARKNWKLITITYPQQPEEETNGKVLSEVIENHQEQPQGPIRTNVTDKFKNFKIQYIGIEYGEGEYYSFSHDGKIFYNFENKNESWELIINKGLSANAFDEILWVQPLPKQMLVSKALTWNYQTQPTDILHYAGSNNGFEETVYTIQWASGTYVQKGDEVMDYLNKEYRYTIQNAQSGWYDFIGYFIQEGNKKIEVTPTTLCPKGTKIYFRYKEIENKN